MAANFNKDKAELNTLLNLLQGLGQGTNTNEGFGNYSPWSDEPAATDETAGLTQDLANNSGWNPGGAQWSNPWGDNQLTGGGTTPFGLSGDPHSDTAGQGWNLPTVDTPNLGWSPVAYAGMMGAQGQVGAAYINALGRAHTDPLTAISRERAASIGDLLNVVAGGQQERKTLGTKGQQERQTLQDTIAGELAKIYAGATSGTAGKIAEIGAGGKEERLTQQEASMDTLAQITRQALEERAGMTTKGSQDRKTVQSQSAATQREIVKSGDQDRLTAATEGAQERQTLGKQLAGVINQITTKGGQDRETLETELEGILGQIGAKGFQERETLDKKIAGDESLTRLKGQQDRSTQQQELAGIINQITTKGAQERTTLEDQIAGELSKIQETGQETRTTQQERADQAAANMGTHAQLLQDQQTFASNLLQNMPVPDYTATQAYQDLTGMAGQGMRQTNAMNMLGGQNPFAAPLQSIPGMTGGNSLLERQNMYNMQNQFNPAARAQHAQSAMAEGKNLSNQFNQQLANQTAAGRPFRSATGQVRGAIPQIFGQQLAGMSNIGIS